MHEQTFQTIRENAKALAEAQSNLKKAIAENRDPNGNIIDIATKIPEQDYSLTDIDVGISTFISFVENLQPDEQGIVLPRSLLETVAAKIVELKNQIEGTTATFANVVQSQGGIKSIDPATFVIVAAQNDTAHSLAKPIRRIFGLLDAAFAAWFQLRVILKAPRIGEFGRVLYGLSSQQSDLSKLVDANVQLSKTVQDEQKKIADILGQANKERTEVGRLLQEAQNDRKTLSEYSAEGTDKISSIRTTHQEATTLAAATFYELTFNPATRMDANSSENRHPNPVMEYIMKKLGGVEEERKA